MSYCSSGKATLGLCLAVVLGGCRPDRQTRIESIHFHGCDVRVYSEADNAHTLDITYSVDEAAPENLTLLMRSGNASPFKFQLGKRSVTGFPMMDVVVTEGDLFRLSLTGFGGMTVTVDEEPEMWTAVTRNTSAGQVNADPYPYIRVEQVDTSKTQGLLIIDYMGKRVDFDIDLSHDMIAP